MNWASDTLLVLALVALGADRLNWSVGGEAMHWTLFLLVAPLAWLVAWSRDRLQASGDVGAFVSARRQLWVPLAAYLFFAAVSVQLGLDPEAGNLRLLGLAVVCALGYWLAARLLASSHRSSLVLWGVGLALALYLFASLGQILYFYLEDLTDTVPALFEPWGVASFCPRITGQCADPNRAGFLLLVYIVLLDRWARGSRLAQWLHAVAALFLLLTLSRSALVSWAVYELWSPALRRRLCSRRFVLTALLAVLALGGLLVRHAAWSRQLSDEWNLPQIVDERSSWTEGSGATHLWLLQQGAETWMTSPKTFLVGIGFGSADHVLGRFFLDDRHGNFHSLYLSTLAESGILAFAPLLALLLGPALLRQNALRPICAIALFNVTYQVQMEPSFWLILTVLWAAAPRLLGATHRGTVVAGSLTGEAVHNRLQHGPRAA